MIPCDVVCCAFDLGTIPVAGCIACLKQHQGVIVALHWDTGLDNEYRIGRKDSVQGLTRAVIVSGLWVNSFGASDLDLPCYGL